MIRHVTGLALILLSACAANPEAYDLSVPSISKIETRQLPPDVVARRVFDQLGEALSAAPGSNAAKNVPDMLRALAKLDTLDLKPGASPAETRRALDQFAATVSIWPDPTWVGHPQFPLSQLTFMTRSHATAMPGLCVTDPVTLRFRAAGPLRGPWTQVRASDVMVDHEYRFLAPPIAPALAKATDAQRAEADRVCAQLDPDNFDLYFYASDDAQAVRGTWLAKNAQMQFESGHPGFTLDCSRIPKNWTTKCETELKRSHWKPWWVLDCAAAAADCDMDLDGGLTLTITTAPTPAEAITRVTVDPTVIIADSIAD